MQGENGEATTTLDEMQALEDYETREKQKAAEKAKRKQIEDAKKGDWKAFLMKEMFVLRGLPLLKDEVVVLMWHLITNLFFRGMGFLGLKYLWTGRSCKQNCADGAC